MRAVVDDIGVALWRLLPANPIVLRVVSMASKRPQHLAVRVGYLLVLLFVMLMGQISQSGGGSSLASLAKSSSRVFEYISLLQLAMISLLAPVFTAGAISQEKDAETFNVLLTTPLTNAQIVLGSLMSRLFFVIMLLLSGLPIFCITMLYGGVTTEQIFYSFGIAGCTAVLTGSLAILISAMKVGTRGTVFSFYVGIALFLFAGMGLGLLRWTHVLESIPPGGTEGMTWLAPFHPFWALSVALNDTRPPIFAAVTHYPWPVDRMLASPHIAYMIITMLVSAVLVSFATIFVRSGIKQGEASWWTRLRRRWFNSNNAGKRSRRPRRVWRNPMAWREAMTRSGAATGAFAWYSYLICGVAAAVMLLYAYANGWFTKSSEARQWMIVIVLVEFVTVMLMATNTAATAITRERDAGTMELLLTTPLTSRDIVWGKLRGLVSFTLPLLAVPAGTVLVAAIYDVFAGSKPPIVYLDSALILPVLLLIYSAFACMVGLHMSLKSQRSVQAVLVSVGILVGVAFGLGLCAAGILEIPGYIAGLLTPMTFVASIFIVLDPESVATTTGKLAGTVDGVRLMMFIGSLMAGGIYSAIATGIYRTTVRSFDMTIRKQSR